MTTAKHTTTMNPPPSLLVGVAGSLRSPVTAAMVTNEETALLERVTRLQLEATSIGQAEVLETVKKNAISQLETAHPVTFVGNTGAGKTTVMNSFLSKLAGFDVKAPVGDGSTTLCCYEWNLVEQSEIPLKVRVVPEENPILLAKVVEVLKKDSLTTFPEERAAINGMFKWLPNYIHQKYNHLELEPLTNWIRSGRHFQRAALDPTDKLLAALSVLFEGLQKPFEFTCTPEEHKDKLRLLNSCEIEGMPFPKRIVITLKVKGKLVFPIKLTDTLGHRRQQNLALLEERHIEDRFGRIGNELLSSDLSIFPLVFYGKRERNLNFTSPREVREFFEYSPLYSTASTTKVTERVLLVANLPHDPVTIDSEVLTPQEAGEYYGKIVLTDIAEVCHHPIPLIIEIAGVDDQVTPLMLAVRHAIVRTSNNFLDLVEAGLKGIEEELPAKIETAFRVTFDTLDFPQRLQDMALKLLDYFTDRNINTVRAALRRRGVYDPIDVREVIRYSFYEALAYWASRVEDHLRNHKVPLDVINTVTVTFRQAVMECEEPSRLISELLADEFFWTSVTLESGQGTIQRIGEHFWRWIEAHSIAFIDDINQLFGMVFKKMSAVWFYSSQTTLTANFAATSAKVALLVYCETYPDPKRSLPGTSQEIKSLSTKLKTIGFGLCPYFILSNRPTWDSILAYVRYLLKSLGDDSTFFFCFSGHGAYVNGAPAMEAGDGSLISYGEIYNVISELHNGDKHVNALVHNACASHCPGSMEIPLFPSSAVLIQSSVTNSVSFSNFFMPVLISNLRTGVSLSRIFTEAGEQARRLGKQNDVHFRAVIDRWHLANPGFTLVLPREGISPLITVGTGHHEILL